MSEEQEKPVEDSKKKKLNHKEETLSDGTKVKVRKPKLRDIRAHFDEPNLEERQVLITSSLTQLSEDELDELDYDDFLKLQAAAESFLSPRGKTASTE